MNRHATTTLILILTFFASGTVFAQTDVTIREINTIPQANIDAVKALGVNLTQNDITTNIRSTFDGEENLRFTAVVLSDPRKSGLSSPRDEGFPSRVHYFVRDTTAAAEGPSGMDIQIVDGNYQTTGSLQLFVGDVVTFVGEVAYFGTGVQFSPTTLVVQDPGDFPLSDTFMDPVTVTIGDINRTVGDLQIQANWDNFNALNQQYVRIEGVTVWRSPNRTDSRPNWALQDANGDIIQNDDISLRFRNDRDTYSNDFDKLSEAFIAPPAGSTVNIQGFALLRTDWDPFTIGLPPDGVMKIVPWKDSDLEITEKPIDVTKLSRPATVPGPDEVTITADISVDPSRFISSAKLMYTTSSNATPQGNNPFSVDGDTYSFHLPAQPDGEFVTYWVEATDNGGGSSISEKSLYRVLNGGITTISHIQQTADGGEGDGPFRNMTVDVDLTVTVQTDPATGMSFVQDDPALGPWSGVFLRSNPLQGSNKGDVIHITHARMEERFGLTRLSNITFEIVSQGGDPLGYKDLTTDVLQDDDIAEQYEGMLVTLDDVFVAATNADANLSFCPCGEFTVSTNGTTSEFRVDDLSRLVEYGVEDTPTEDDPATVFSVWELLDFVRGPLYYSFGNFKVVPETLADDVGAVLNVATEGEAVPTSFALKQNFPNPFNPTTLISYDIGTMGLVNLDVYDALGRKVRTLVRTEQTPGSYSIEFNAGNLASGVYLYRLSAGNKIVSRTMLLLK